MWLAVAAMRAYAASLLELPPAGEACVAGVAPIRNFFCKGLRFSINGFGKRHALNPTNSRFFRVYACGTSSHLSEI